MATYAKDTDVPVERSKAEIEATVMRYGASAYGSGWMGKQAMITFELNGRRIRFNLPLPDPEAEEFQLVYTNQHQTPENAKRRSPEAARKLWEQACRQKWRALALVIKAKLEAVESRISTIDEEFLAHIVMPNGKTIGEKLVPQIDHMVSNGKMPPLLEHS